MTHESSYFFNIKANIVLLKETQYIDVKTKNLQDLD